MNFIEQFLNNAEKRGLYTEIFSIKKSPTSPEIKIGQKTFISFSSNNYLGLANNNKVKKAVIEGVKIYGMGSGGSRLLSGNTKVQEDLETSIATFKGCQSSITFATGYMANVGAIPALMNNPYNKYFPKYLSGGINKSTIFSDELNHASIIDGCRLSKSKIVVYKHLDVEDLEKKVRKYGKRNSLIVTDGIFSMDGDIAPLDKIVNIGKKYNVKIMVDDAHASGVLGNKGKGTLEYFNIEEKEVDAVMGTFTKAFGGVGGFIAGNAKLIKYLRIAARTYIFTAPIAPPIAMGLLESIKIASGEEGLRDKLWNNADYLRNKLTDIGFKILGQTHILPIFIGEEEKAITFSKKLFQKGIYAPSVRWPAVKKGSARLRVTVTSSHVKNQLDRLIEACSQIGEELKIL
ncbi:8-amino-7-oxononanoate synthase [candidate division WWE3 bacterium CG10_big_fil_rev_8_21_14_0_10_32_10]|uniref:8-amino-7-oxononanoate synthase n=1 Tax=candidate division WWE3 bacterium CG10_big_fil_rev_8_21_14_0_10_32_10 TaxID=1975090 RepID=A0A2H0R9M8_UNCKA|nr:MAG: 8-amino-7-oxononanoate synthase [candidate division WWE3 bacterium CG10_big_fil_rev_8_21_14_0_10_32_10]